MCACTRCPVPLPLPLHYMNDSLHAVDSLHEPTVKNETTDCLELEPLTENWL